MTYLSHHVPQTAQLLLQHIELVAAGLALALIVALPLGFFAARKAALATPIFGSAGVIYTIPSLALLALAVKYLGLGFWPLVLVLAAYAQFILIRAAATALQSVPAAQLDAATGLGMSPTQRLLRIEIPLAMPVFLGGLRLATVASIAIATLGGYVGAGGLGDDIFFGLQRQYLDQTLAGSIPAALLAIAADALLRLMERAYARRITA
ncbi:MAG TPA: ABC transporter permease subunit [Candidatus Baltobacteraceae bacterium]|jgi:osmoprotectant transport system permease protein|nr:ABC transporter permease subunit [Candidatus Baltobacteraceae bacterium]